MSDVLARLMRWMETSDIDDADVVLRDAITEIAGLRARLDERRRDLSGLTRFVAVVAIVAASVAFAVGWWVATPKKPQRHAAAEGYEDLLVHPETTPEVKWVKMTKQTRDTLLEIYAENMDECGRYMQECDRVTIGEAAILWLMDRAEDK